MTNFFPIASTRQANNVRVKHAQNSNMWRHRRIKYTNREAYEAIFTKYLAWQNHRISWHLHRALILPSELARRAHINWQLNWHFVVIGSRRGEGYIQSYLLNKKLAKDLCNLVRSLQVPWRKSPHTLWSLLGSPRNFAIGQNWYVHLLIAKHRI